MFSYKRILCPPRNETRDSSACWHTDVKDPPHQSAGNQVYISIFILGNPVASLFLSSSTWLQPKKHRQTRFFNHARPLTAVLASATRILINVAILYHWPSNHHSSLRAVLLCNKFAQDCDTFPAPRASQFEREEEGGQGGLCEQLMNFLGTDEWRNRTLMTALLRQQHQKATGQSK